MHPFHLTDSSLSPIAEKVRRGRAPVPRGRHRAVREQRPARHRADGRLRPPAHQRRARLLHGEPAHQPHEHLPQPLQVLRVRPQRRRRGRLRDDARHGRRGGSRGCGRRRVRDPHRERPAPRLGLRLLPRHGPPHARGRARPRDRAGLHRRRDRAHGDHQRQAHARGPARPARRRARRAARRRGRDLLGPDAHGGVGQEDEVGRVAAHPRRGALAGHQDQLHDALRSHRDARRARRPPHPPARAARCERRLPRIHPALVPPRQHRARGPAGDDRLRRPQDARDRATDARQHPAHQGVLDHGGPQDRPDLDRVRCRRHRRHRGRGAHHAHGRRDDARGAVERATSSA